MLCNDTPQMQYIHKCIVREKYSANPTCTHQTHGTYVHTQTLTMHFVIHKNVYVRTYVMLAMNNQAGTYAGNP